MSHVATVALKIRDLDALAVAAERCGLKLVRDAKTYSWFGTWVNDYSAQDAAYHHGIKPEEYGKCAHKLTRADGVHAYEIGLIQRDGHFVLAWDFYGVQGERLLQKAGKGCVNLVREYAAEVARKTLVRQGFMPAGRRTMQDGTVQMTFAK